MGSGVASPEPLAQKIRSESSALEGERKQITVMFADVAGFTSLSERFDPEETHATMRRFLASLQVARLRDAAAS
jgi:class 3 adenylate cyclase